MNSASTTINDVAPRACPTELNVSWTLLICIANVLLSVRSLRCLGTGGTQREFPSYHGEHHIVRS
jgi:hypothetical protein